MSSVTPSHLHPPDGSLRRSDTTLESEVDLRSASLTRLEQDSPQQVDLSSFPKALEALPPGPFRAQVLEHFQNLKSGINRLSPVAEARASALLEQLSSSQLKQIVETLVAERSTDSFRTPLAHYRDIIREDPNQDERERGELRRFVTTLLTDGLLPTDFVQEHLRLSNLTLESSAQSPDSLQLAWVGIPGLALAWTLASHLEAAIVTSISLVVCGLARRDTLIARDVVKGYTLESLDTYETIRSGAVKDLGLTLNEHFADPARPSQFNKQWQTTGFLFARILRVFGSSQDEVFSLFQREPVINHNYNIVVEAARAHLADTDAPIPPSILVPFMSEESEDDPFKVTREVIYDLQDAYFTCAIAQREQIRLDCAKLILQVAT